jgi:hypothetical protein
MIDDAIKVRGDMRIWQHCQLDKAVRGREELLFHWCIQSLTCRSTLGKPAGEVAWWLTIECRYLARYAVLSIVSSPLLLKSQPPLHPLTEEIQSNKMADVDVPVSRKAFVPLGTSSHPTLPRSANHL